MLNAVRAPLVLGNFTEDSGALIQQFINDAVLGLRFEVLECMLHLSLRTYIPQIARHEPERQENLSHGKQGKPICPSKIY
jgi:hypothetical protein